MAFIIPDKILETLICDSCHKYLSVKPIKVYRNRRTKCGRCSRSKKQSDGIVSLYGVIAETCLFKCVNKFDGCRELLMYSQVREHEKVCFGKVYSCPICSEHTEIPTFLLPKHFQDHHNDSILDCASFIFNPNSQSETSHIYLYREEDNLFFLNFRSSKLEKTLRLNLFYIGDATEAKNMQQQFTISSENKDLDVASKSKPCSTYGESSCDYLPIKITHINGTIVIKFRIIFTDPRLINLPEEFAVSVSTSEYLTIEQKHTVQHNFVPMVKDEPVRKIFLNDRFIHKFPKYSLSSCCTAIVQIESQTEYYLHCYNCQEICWRGLSHDILVQKFYRSIFCNHSICYYCFQLLKNEQILRDCDYIVSDLPKGILQCIQFFCKWGCGEPFEVQYHLGHEQSCSLQPLQRCPEYDCNYRGTIVDVAAHMGHHVNKELCTFSSLYISSLFDRHIYITVNNKFVYLEVVSNSGFSIKTNLIVYKDDCTSGKKLKALVMLFDDSKHFQMSFQNSITKNKANHWVKIIVTKDN